MPSPVSGLLGRSARLHHLCPPLWSLFFYLTAQLLALTYSHKCIHSIPSSQLHSFIHPSPTPSLTNTLTCSPVHSSATHSLFIHSFVPPSFPPSLTNTLTCSPVHSSATHSLFRTHLHIQLPSFPWQLHPRHRRAHDFSEVNLLLSCNECISDFSIFSPPRINLRELCSVSTLVHC